MKSLVMLAALAAASPVAAQAQTAPAKGPGHAGHTAPAPAPAPPKGATDHTGHGSGEHKERCACCKDKASPQAKCADKPAAPAQPGDGAHDHH